MMTWPNRLRIDKHELELKIAWICGELPKYAALAVDTRTVSAAPAAAAAWISAILL